MVRALTSSSHAIMLGIVPRQRSSGVAAITTTGSTIAGIAAAVITMVSSTIAVVTTAINSTFTSGTTTPLVSHIYIVSGILIYELCYTGTLC